MRSIPSWTDKIEDKADRSELCVYDIAFRPDGYHVIVAAGNRVLVYLCEDGTLIQSLRAHKDLVYCVSYAKDGKRFASGSKDKQVIIWTSKLDGVLKYSHNDAIQCLAYNPTSPTLASCAVSDFGLWSPDQKMVQKHKVSSRVTSCSWTTDGQLLALGLYSGSVSVRNRNGNEVMRTERPGGHPVWSVCFSTGKDDPSNVLCIADWNQTLSFYHMNGKQAYKDRQLDFDPLCVSYFGKGEYLLVSGSNRQTLLYTREGIKIGQIGDEQDSWVWCCRPKPDSNHILIGCQDGTLSCYQMVFSTVHGLHKDRYAYRDNMTDVIIQHLITEQRVRIKCRDLVKKIAIYKHRLAVQLPEKITIYELYSGDANDMHYRIKEKIHQSIQCNLLVVCSNHIVLCQERRLQCWNFVGIKEHEWLLESLIRYIKVIGGPSGREGLLLGLKNGHVLKIFLDNPFPILLVKIGCAVRCLDLSATRTKLAVVDEQNTCFVYDLSGTSGPQLLYQEPNANSVAWNCFYENMLCYSGNGMLSIKVADFPIHQQKLQGFVVGFCGSKVFCLHVYSMATVEIPLSAPMFQYMDRGGDSIKEAYNIACLGVTDKDWGALAERALDQLNMEVAKKAFIRQRELKYLELIQNVENRKKQGGIVDDAMLADVLAYRGLFAEAAKLYQSTQQNPKAIQMYTDLCMFDQAQEFISKYGVEGGGGSTGGKDDTGSAEIEQKSLLKKKAEWAANINEPRTAVEMYLTAGEAVKAIEIAGENGWIETLVDISLHKLDKADRAPLQLCAEYLKKLNQFSHAADVYAKLGNYEALARLRVETKMWEEAFLLAKKYPDLNKIIYLPYALELAEKDKFLEAHEAFRKAGKPEMAFQTLEALTKNAVQENRFNDAAHFYWILSQHCLDVGLSSEVTGLGNRKLSELQQRYSHYANVYYGYHVIQRFIDEPFTSYMPESIFNIARYLYHKLLLPDVPPKVSKVFVLYAIAKQGKTLGAYKLARFAYDKLRQLRVPDRFRDLVDLGSLALRSKPFHDAEELLPLCYRCSTTNPLLNNRGGNCCVNCNQPFVFSLVTFEVLPLVEFRLEEGLSDSEAISLINQCSAMSSKTGSSWKEQDNDGYQMLALNEHEEKVDEQEMDPFSSKNVMSFQEGGGSKFTPVVVGRKALAALERTDMVVARPKVYHRNQTKFYRNFLPHDVPVVSCPSCGKLFHVDDWELQVLQLGHCPFCRVSQKENGPVTSDMD